MQQLVNPAQNKSYKIIKVYKIEGEKIDAIKKKLQQISKILKQWVHWSSIQTSDINQNYFIFPNQSIYNDGIRISYLQKNQIYLFEMIKSKWKINLNDSFCYQYQTSVIYDNPIPLLKSFGYNHHKRKSKNATIFRSLKFGLEVILYSFGEKDQNSQEVKKGKLEVIETGSYPFNNRSLIIPQLEQILGQHIIKPVQNQLDHQKMTLKYLGSIQQYK